MLSRVEEGRGGKLWPLSEGTALSNKMTWSLEAGHYLFKEVRWWQEVLVCKAGLMLNSSGVVIPRVCLCPTLNPTTLLPLLSLAPSAPTSGRATSENGRNNTAFVHHSALGLLLNKCSEEEFWWLALPLGPGWSYSDFINNLWGDQKNKSAFIGSYMVMELFTNQLDQCRLFIYFAPAAEREMFCCPGHKHAFLGRFGAL